MKYLSALIITGTLATGLYSAQAFGNTSWLKRVQGFKKTVECRELISNLRNQTFGDCTRSLSSSPTKTPFAQFSFGEQALGNKYLILNFNVTRSRSSSISDQPGSVCKQLSSTEMSFQKGNVTTLVTLSAADTKLKIQSTLGGGLEALITCQD
jgi:hypothetical protein